MSTNKENIFAIPSKDRLNDESVDLLAQAGINVQISGRQLSKEASLREAGRFTVAFMRPKDIVESVATGEVQLGITGLDTFEEWRLGENLRKSLEDQWGPQRKPLLLESTLQTPKVLLGLEFGQSRLVLATQTERGFQTAQDWWNSVKFWNKDEQFDWVAGAGPSNQINVATSYPNLTRKFIGSLRPKLEPTDRVSLFIREMSGAVEVAPAIGLADAIADLVETGTTIKTNGLVELTTIFESEAVLITSASRRGESRMVDAIYGRLYNSFLKRGIDPFARLRGYEQFRLLV